MRFSMKCWLALIANLAAWTVGAQAATVTIYPGQDVQSIVAANPPGTTFHLTSGVYWNQSVTPKSGDVFNGDPGTIFTGGRFLGGPFGQDGGGHYVVYGQYQHGQPEGQCDPQHPACMYPEDLFLNDSPLHRVTSASQVGPGRWFFDYANHQIIFADDPAGKRLETSLTAVAFSGGATNVTITNLTVQKYANPAEFAAIGGQYPGTGWIVSGVETWLNHGPGVRVASNSQVLNSYLHSQGSIGVTTSDSSNVLIQGNELAFNNFAGFEHAYEAGGGKFANTSGLVVRGNKSHDNIGPGFWTDTDNVNTTYDNNTVYNNQDIGIQHEISFSATIKNNTVYNNGSASTGWLWGSQILVQNSQNVEVVGNVVNVPAGYGNGIGMVNQNRGSGKFGAYVLQNNYAHSNDITYQPGSNALSGVAADYDFAQTFNGSNRFDYNAYHLADPNSYSWAYQGVQNWVGFQGYGQDLHGTVDSSIKPTP